MREDWTKPTPHGFGVSTRAYGASDALVPFTEWTVFVMRRPPWREGLNLESMAPS
jgi:hypothetical protein